MESSGRLPVRRRSPGRQGEGRLPHRSLEMARRGQCQERGAEVVGPVQAAADALRRGRRAAAPAPGSPRRAAQQAASAPTSASSPDGVRPDSPADQRRHRRRAIAAGHRWRMSPGIHACPAPLRAPDRAAPRSGRAPPERWRPAPRRVARPGRCAGRSPSPRPAATAARSATGSPADAPASRAHSASATRMVAGPSGMRGRCQRAQPAPEPQVDRAVVGAVHAPGAGLPRAHQVPDRPRPDPVRR